MIIIVYERWNWSNFSEKERNKYRKLKNKLKRTTGKAKKDCLEGTFDKIMKLKKKKRSYDLMYFKKQELSWKENHGIRIISKEDFQGNKIIDH